VAEMALAAALLRQADRGTIVYWFGGWTPRHGVALGISFTVDPIGAGGAVLAGLVVVAAVATTGWTIDEAHGIVHALLLTLLAAMAGFCLTGDLFNMFVFFELMAVSSFALMAFVTQSRAGLRSALNFAITNSIGAFMVLIGIALLYGRTGALNLAQIGAQLGARGHFDRLTVVALSLLMAGFLIKAAVVPFHFWLVDTAASAPLPLVMILAGALDTLGVYAVARVYWTVFATSGGDHRDVVRAVLITIGAVSAGAGGILALLWSDARRRLGFVMVSHTGILLIGVGCLSASGLAGAAIYAAGDGTVKAALFLGVALAGLGRADDRRSGVLAGSRGVAGAVVGGSAGAAGAAVAGGDRGGDPGGAAAGGDASVVAVGGPARASARGSGSTELISASGASPVDGTAQLGPFASPAGRRAGLILLVVGGLASAGFPIFATGLGKAAIGDAAGAAGFWWVTPLIVVGAVLGAGSVLDLAWSGARAPRPAVGAAPEHPGVWLAPFVVGACLLASSGVATVAGRWATRAAVRFVDTAGYQRLVLGGAPATTGSTAATIGLSAPGVVLDLLIVAAAIGLAAVLNWDVANRVPIIGLASIRQVVGRLHDGSIGDSVTWVTLGTAIIALVLAAGLH